MQLHETQMEEIFIMNVVHIYNTSIIEAGIDSLYINNHLGGIMQGIDTLKFIPIHLGDLERSK